MTVRTPSTDVPFLGNDFTCVQETVSCLWNSRLSAVGCVDSDLQPYVTECRDYNDTAACDQSCSQNPAIKKWYAHSHSLPLLLQTQLISRAPSSSLYRYCHTVMFPDGYSFPNCATSRPKTEMSVALTYAGFITPIYLPRRKGTDGLITAETQYPEGYSTSTSRPTSTSPRSTYTVTTTPTPRPKSSNKAGPIAGGVIGGVAFLTAIAAGLFILWRRRKRTADSAAVEARSEPYRPKNEMPENASVTAWSPHSSQSYPPYQSPGSYSNTYNSNANTLSSHSPQPYEIYSPPQQNPVHQSSSPGHEMYAQQQPAYTQAGPTSYELANTQATR
jgi:hypothetical protein